MSELSAIPSFSSVAVASGAVSQAAPASGARAFGAVLRESLTSGAAPESPRQNLVDSLTSNAAVIAAAAAPAMPLPVQPVSVAAAQGATEGTAFGLPAGFTGTMTYIGDGARAVLGTPMLAQPSVPLAPISSAQPNPSPVLDVTPGPISAAQAATMMSAPPITWTRGVPSVEVPRVEVGADIPAPPTTFTATQMTPAPVAAAPVAEEPEMPDEPEEGDAIAPGFDALAHASAEVGLPGDLVSGLSAAAATVKADIASARRSATQTATSVHMRSGARAAVVDDATTDETDGQPSSFSLNLEADTNPAETVPGLPRAASAATANAYESASVAAAGRAADVTAAGTRPDAELVLRETARSSQPRTLAGAQAARAAAAGAPLSGRVVDQVANGLSLAVREGRTEATLTLRPDTLGEVRVQIVSGPEGLTIRLSAERAAVGELLRSGLADLQDALAAHRLSVAEVHVMHHPSAAAPTDTPLWQERPWSRQQPEAEDGEQPQRRQPQDEQDDE